MGYTIPMGDAQRAIIRCYRSAAATTGSSGMFVNLAWDAESSTPAKRGFAHSISSNAEQIVAPATDVYSLIGAVKLVAGTWDELRASIEINGVAFHTPNCGSSTGLLGLASGPATLVLACSLDLTAGQIVRVRVASVGQANVAIDVGETDTWIELRQR